MYFLIINKLTVWRVENLDWMSVVKVLLLAWKLRMKLSKKQVKTRRIGLRERLFPTIRKSHAWSVRWQHSNLESITNKKENVNDWTVRRMLRIQALEAAKREDYRTRTRVQKIYIKDKITRNITIKEITHFPKKEETPAEVETQVTE